MSAEVMVVDGVAVYAAVVATASALVGLFSIAWQIRTTVRSRREEAHVEVGLAPSGHLTSHYLVVEVVNTGVVPLYVKSVALVHNTAGGGRGTTYWPRPDRATLPGPVQPGDAGFTYRQHTPTNLTPPPEAWVVATTPRKTYVSRVFDFDSPGVDLGFRFLDLLPDE